MKTIFRRFGLSHLVAVLAVALVLGSGTAYAAKQITSKNIKNNTIKSIDVKDGALTGTDVADGTIGSADILDGTITSADVATDTLTAADLAANSVGSSEVADNSLTANDLGSNSVNSDEIATDAVQATEIQDNSIDSGEIVDNSLFSADLGAGAVHASELGTITERDAVSANIAAGGNGSVTASCLAGEKVIGGGVDGFFDVFIVASRQSGNGWAVFGHNDSGGNRTITAHAYCLQV